MKMLVGERQQKIYEKISREGSVKVAELSVEYGVGAETIRRDLNQMEKEGMLEKAYGGAIIKHGKHIELPTKAREAAFTENKILIGKKCATLIEPGDTLFLDASSTCLFTARALVEKEGLVVITNAINIARIFVEFSSSKVILAGGRVRKTSYTCVGGNTQKYLENFNVDKAILGCNGVSMENGITDANEEEAEVRRVMIKNSEIRILAADHSKLGRTYFYRISLLDDFHYLATDKGISPEWKKFCEQKEICIL